MNNVKSFVTIGTYPKTLIIDDGDFDYRVYHVDNACQAVHLIEGLDRYTITLQDYSPELEETRPNWRHQVAKWMIKMLPKHLMLREDAPAPVEEINDDY